MTSTQPAKEAPRMSRASKRGQIAAILGAVALMAAGILLSFYVDRSHQIERLDELSAQARILAATATAALAFGDHKAAEEYVDALRVNREISAAALYDLSGHMLAGFSRDGAPKPPAMFSDRRSRRSRLLDITAEVRQAGTPLGFILLQTPAEPLSARLQRYAPIMLLLAMAALLVAVLGFAQSTLRRANAALAAHADELEAANRRLEDQILQREEAEAALRQAQKMEAVGQLTGGIAHDFNNLLQVVLGSLERLRLRASRTGRTLDPDLDRPVEAAIQSAQRAAMLTQRLLAFSRRQPLAPKPVDANRLVGGMADLLTRTLGESIRIEIHPCPGLWPTLVDENQLENALLNLAVNARDAMPDGGSLTIETANIRLDEAYARAEREVRPGDYVLLAVSDMGCGMTPEVLAKVFEPFFTTKGIGRGTGLGLSQVYGFIRQSGGHTKLYSEPGRGTTIRIYLPRLLAADARDDVAAVSAPPPPRGDSDECILVVEDEEGVRALSAEILQDLGYAVLQAADGFAALEILKRRPPVKLLFTDVGLPNGMTGRDLADAARSLCPELKVLFTTGYERNAIAHGGRLDPGVELISKPFAAADLAHRVRTLLDAASKPDPRASRSAAGG